MKNQTRKTRIGLVCLIVGLLGFLIFGCLSLLYVPSFDVMTHRPVAGFKKFRCPIFLGRNEQSRILVSIENTKNYPLHYKTSLYQSRNHHPYGVLIAQVSSTLPANETIKIEFPINGGTTEKLVMRVEAISGEDPVWVEGGSHVLYPWWNSSFAGGCEIRPIRVPIPINIILRIAFWIFLILGVLGAGALLGAKLVKEG